eukprot:COSAG02_NODE_37_length_48203_cov_57.745708_26_plen_144_part_00
MCTRLQISPIRAAVVASRNIARCVLKPHRQPETRRGPSNLPAWVRGAGARMRAFEFPRRASRNEAARAYSIPSSAIAREHVAVTVQCDLIGPGAEIEFESICRGTGIVRGATRFRERSSATHANEMQGSESLSQIHCNHGGYM